MKRIIVSVLLICMMICMCSCSANTDSKSETETLANDSYSSTNPAGQIEWRVKSIPFTMNFDEKEVDLHDIKFFELYADHGYTAWIIVSIDRTNLTDDDIYWITKPGTALHKDLEVYLSNVKIDGANVDVNRLKEVGSLHSDKYMYYVFCSDLSRYSFMGEKFQCSVYYSPESAINPDGVSYYYSFDISEENYSDSADILSEEEARALYQLIS